MKKFTLSVAAVMAMSTFAIAGGDIAPVEEPMVEVAAPAIDDSGFYVGLGYSYMMMEKDWGDEIIGIITPSQIMGEGIEEVTENAVLLLAGYNFNKYIAVEGRYTKGIGDLDSDMDGEIDGDLSNIGLYLKPMYPLGGVTLYGLLGFGKVTLEEPDYGIDNSESGFQWGLGASMEVTENVGVFVDYTRLYDDTGFDDTQFFDGVDMTIDSVNVGVTYKF